MCFKTMLIARQRPPMMSTSKQQQLLSSSFPSHQEQSKRPDICYRLPFYYYSTVVSSHLFNRTEPYYCWTNTVKMDALSGKKRSREESAADAKAPACDSKTMTDRMKLKDMLQKETAVRFAKVQAREGNGNKEAQSSYSTTLQSDQYLMQVYPATKPLEEDNDSWLVRDRWYYHHRKSRASLSHIKSSIMDESLIPIYIEGYDILRMVSSETSS